jgi:hypothetical protein
MIFMKQSTEWWAQSVEFGGSGEINIKDSERDCTKYTKSASTFCGDGGCGSGRGKGCAGSVLSG